MRLTCRNIGRLDLEHAGDCDNARETYVGDGDAVTMSECARGHLGCKPPFEGLKAGREPMDLPRSQGGIVNLALYGMTVPNPGLPVSSSAL